MAHQNLDTDFLYDNLPVGSVSYLANGQILRVNQTFSNWLGISMDEIYQMDFKSVLHKPSALYYSLVVDPLLNLQHSVNEINLTFLTSTGKFHGLLNAISYNGEDGKPNLIHATIQQITDRKKYESSLLQDKRHADQEYEKFKFLSNTIPNHIWTLNQEGQCIYVNQRMIDYFGEQSLDFYSGFNGIVTEDRPECIKIWATCLKSGEAFEREIQLMGTRKSVEWFFVSIVPYKNPDGAIESWFGSSTNIHRQKKVQLANNSSLKLSLSSAQQIIDANKKLLTSIAFNQSHVIRKPLANIIGLLQLLKEDELPEESRILFTMLQASIEELDKMIRSASNPINIPID
jgi:PAS domain S-box-containing protein